jgi:hypothetical protein
MENKQEAAMAKSFKKADKDMGAELEKEAEYAAKQVKAE